MLFQCADAVLSRDDHPPVADHGLGRGNHRRNLAIRAWAGNLAAQQLPHGRGAHRRRQGRAQIESVRCADQLDANNASALLKLGVIAIDREDAGKAKQAIQSALRINPVIRDADYYLGRTEMLAGNYEAAIAPFKRAIAGNSDPDIVEQAWYQLGIVYRRLGRTEEAKQALTMFQRLKDESSERQRNLFERKREAQIKANSQAEEVPPKE